MPGSLTVKPARSSWPLTRLLQTAFVATVLVCIACEKPAQQYEYSIFVFGTLIDIKLYDIDKKRAEQAFERLQTMFDAQHQQWSPWTNGDLAQLNEQLGKNADGTTPVTVPEHLIPIIERSIELSRLSNNYYNPAIGRLINLWQFHKYQDSDIHPPDPAGIQSLIDSKPQMSDLSFDEENRLTNKNPALLLNFGAFAKGFAIGLGIAQLRELGIDNAIINAGGDLSVIGQHGDRAWNIGIRHPRNDSILASVEVKNNESVFTSGDYERYYYHGSQRYHHILDPATGYPTGDAQSVTVIHQDPGLADAAATALFVAGSKNWQAIAGRMHIDHVMLIDANGDIYLTPAMQTRVKFLNRSPASRIIVSNEL